MIPLVLFDSVQVPGNEKRFRLYQRNFEVSELRVRAHGSKGARHTIWFARRVV